MLKNQKVCGVNITKRIALIKNKRRWAFFIRSKSVSWRTGSHNPDMGYLPFSQHFGRREGTWGPGGFWLLASGLSASSYLRSLAYLLSLLSYFL